MRGGMARARVAVDGGIVGEWRLFWSVTAFPVRPRRKI